MPAAIFMTGGAVVAALGLAAAPAAYADDEGWGAIAVSIDGKSVGVATNQPNEYLANEAATNDCRQGDATCNVLISFKSPDCGAVVKSDDHYFGDSGATTQEAEQNAMNQSPGSTVLRSACNDNSSAGTSSTPTSEGTTPTSEGTTPTSPSNAPAGG
ncbi:DUF4189 domain-containing protein [Mycobacterium shimoidei]|uniref:DUF4189 domain-containing protein n=1 Tax=Mycobacterium shimoidei TaxID=29313 RepID=UPI0008488214|nr:DUF4189 domain-containing protein [Mycobacterium shimoidei]MCV7259519.1 DUF4189 domain-containing protein [Mycobacterium shimoidei]ODR14615.1 hypothetical protein BHQ16_04030 [Mycobacterium shimoidei]